MGQQSAARSLLVVIVLIDIQIVDLQKYYLYVPVMLWDSEVLFRFVLTIKFIFRLWWVLGRRNQDAL